MPGKLFATNLNIDRGDPSLSKSAIVEQLDWKKTSWDCEAEADNRVK